MALFPVLSWLVLIAVGAVQAWKLDSYAWREFDSIVVPATFIAVSAAMGVHWTTAISLRSAALRTGLMWMLYSWAISLKMVLMRIFDIAFDPSWTFYLLLTPIVYGIMMTRSSVSMYGWDSKLISRESLMHSTLIARVALDLFDLMYVGYFQTQQEMYLYPESFPYDVAFFVVMVVGVILHSFSFPTSEGSGLSSTVVGLRGERMQSTDLLLTSKHVALVTIFFVDLPLLVMRVVSSARYPAALALSPMIVKNFLSIVMASAMLHRCRLVEREQAKATTAVVPEAQELPGMEAEANAPQVAVARRVSSEAPSNGNETEKDEDAVSPTSEEDQLLPESVKRRIVKASQLNQFFKTIKSVRSLPPPGFSRRKIIHKLINLCFIPYRAHLALFLDYQFVVPYWRQLKIILVYTIFVVARVALVVVGLMNITNGKGNNDIGSWNSPHDIPIEFVIAFSIIGANGLIALLIWIRLAHFLDTLYITLFTVVRQLSFWMSFVTFRDTRFFALPGTGIVVSNVTITIEGVLLLAFTVPALLEFLVFLIPTHHAFLGKRYIYYTSRRLSKRLDEQLRSLTTKAKNVGDPAAYNVDARTDEAGVVSTASATLFINCRMSTAPTGIHELIVGPNLLKSVRVIDALAITSTWELFICLLVKFASLVLNFNYTNMGIFVGHFAMKIIYHSFAQTIRVLALRRYEVKYLFEEVLQCVSSTEEKEDSQEEKRRRFIGMCDLIDEIRINGFFTSPGYLFPPLCI